MYSSQIIGWMCVCGREKLIVKLPMQNLEVDASYMQQQEYHLVVFMFIASGHLVGVQPYGSTSAQVRLLLPFHCINLIDAAALNYQCISSLPVQRDLKLEKHVNKHQNGRTA